jgi:hypothetical protein
MKVGAKLAELVPLTYNHAKRSCDGSFGNERTRSTLLDLKIIFSIISNQFVSA